ncbi:hypothetical protein G6F57_014273 [Rhizopus arrhizus]|nr:hypothetical protein G6F65_015938 [Rhizopus arrhizus]KAG1460744.1 hypothetical protein G6F57_014273 [Rhizopus arrhizus]
MFFLPFGCGLAAGQPPAVETAVGQGFPPGRQEAAHYGADGGAGQPGRGRTKLNRGAPPPCRPRSATTKAQASGLVGVGGEALAAATLGGGVRVAEREGLAQAVLAEVDHRAVHQRQTLGIDVDLHAVLVEHGIAFALVAGQVGDVAPAGTAGLGHAETQTQRAGGLGDEALHALEGNGGQADGHGATPEVRGHYKEPLPRKMPRKRNTATGKLPCSQIESISRGFKS